MQESWQSEGSLPYRVAHTSPGEDSTQISRDGPFKGTPTALAPLVFTKHVQRTREDAREEGYWKFMMKILDARRQAAQQDQSSITPSALPSQNQTQMLPESAPESEIRQLTLLSPTALINKVRSLASSDSIVASLEGDSRRKERSSSSTDLRAVDSEGELSFIQITGTEEEVMSAVEQDFFNSTWKALAHRLLQEYLSSVLRTNPVASSSSKQNAGSKEHGMSSASKLTSSPNRTSMRKRSAKSQEDSEDGDGQEDTRKTKRQDQAAPIHEFGEPL